MQKSRPQRLGSQLLLTLIISASVCVSSANAIPAKAQTGSVLEWVKLNEPNENAFTFEVPKNWSSSSGVGRRPGAPMGIPWLSAASGDGATKLFVGPPALPRFVLPGGFLREGQSAPGSAGGTVCMRFQTGQEFAASYGPKLLPQNCSNVKLELSKDEPEIAAKANNYMGAQRAASNSVGSAKFSYDLAGEKKIAEFIVQTLLMPGAGRMPGSWVVVNVWGYNTIPGKDESARQTLDHVKASLLPDPQWAASQMRAMNEQAAQNSAMLQQQAGQASAMLKQQADSNQALLNARHAQGMQAIQNVGARAKAQADSDAQWHSNAMVNHYGQMAVKDNNNYHEVLMIQNKHLEWSPDLHANVAVPNGY